MANKKPKVPAKPDPYVRPEVRKQIIEKVQAKYPPKRPPGTTLH